METQKDYYAALGILPNAELIVIRAAYKALAQKYHPDRAPNDPRAARIMQAINEAYEILSNEEKRKEYDAAHNEYSDKHEYSEDQEDVYSAFEQAAKSYDDRWQVAVEYFPDLPNISAQLAKTSRNLAFTFKTMILESKQFSKRKEIAKYLEQNFLETYFGKSEVILSFARELIRQSRKDVAKELNKVITILGDSEPDEIINRLKNKHKIKTAVDTEKITALAMILKNSDGNTAFTAAGQILELMGGSMTYEVTQRDIFGMAKTIEIKVKLYGESYTFNGEDMFSNWMKSRTNSYL